jgi:hypothetical protein
MGEGSLSGWTEGILLSIAFVLVLGIIITNFNGLYGRNEQLGLGTNTTSEDFIKYQETASEQIRGGEATFDASQGITLKSSWGITKEAFNVVASFITGGWIEQVFEYSNLGEGGQVLAKYLRVLFFLSLVFALLYILFKIIP